MDVFLQSINKIYAALALIPVIPFVIVLFGYGAVVQDRKKAFRIAMDVTTIFLIWCVAALFNLLFGSNFGIYGILLVMLLGGGLLGNAQFRKRGAVDVKRVLRTVWRLCFFAMSVLYIVFMFISIGKIVFTV